MRQQAPLRRHQDDGRFGRRLDRFDCAQEHIGFEDHAATAAVGRVIDLAVLVFRVVADVVRVEVEQVHDRVPSTSCSRT